MRKGQIMTEEQKRKIGKANRGKHHTEETKRKIGEGCKGRICTEQARMNYIRANRARMESKEYREKWIKIIQSIEIKEKRNKTHTGFKHSIEFCQKMSRLAKAQWQNPETRKRLLRGLLSPEAKEKQRKIMKKQWADSKSIFNTLEYRRKLIKALILKPNKLEKYFDKLTPDCIEYVGDGRLLIKTRIKIYNPDFRIINQKKIIELYGDYWHRGENPQKKIQEYAEAGWECKVYWENDIRNKIKIILKEILEFINQ